MHLLLFVAIMLTADTVDIHRTGIDALFRYSNTIEPIGLISLETSQCNGTVSTVELSDRIEHGLFSFIGDQIELQWRNATIDVTDDGSLNSPCRYLQTRRSLVFFGRLSCHIEFHSSIGPFRRAIRSNWADGSECSPLKSNSDIDRSFFTKESNNLRSNESYGILDTWLGV